MTPPQDPNEDHPLLAGFDYGSDKPRQYALKLKPLHGSDEPHPATAYVNARRHRTANWATSEGVYRKRKLIEAKGLPSFAGWKFITLTLRRDRFSGPLEGYLAGRKFLAKWMFRCRKAGLWDRSAKWCWKLEFQRDGWAHWHLILEHRPKWSVDQLKQIEQIWGLGMTQAEAVRTDDFAYSFKYAFKPVIQEDEADLYGVGNYALPDWFLDYFKPSDSTDEKPSTFSRARFWQTSAGFYTGSGDQPERPDKPSETCIVPRTARAVAESAHSRVQVVARDCLGRYIKSTVVTLTGCMAAFWVSAAYDTFRGEACGLAVESFIIPVHKLQNNIIEKWKLPELAKQNRLTPRGAEHLPPRNWKIC